MRKFLLLLSVFLSTLSLAAQNTAWFSLNSEPIVPGGEAVEVTLTIHNSANTETAALQMQLDLPDGLEFVDLTEELDGLFFRPNQSLLTLNFPYTIMGNLVNNQRSMRIVLYTMSNRSFSTNRLDQDFSIGTFKVRANSSFKGSGNIQIIDTKIAGTGGSTGVVDSSNFKVTNEAGEVIAPTSKATIGSYYVSINNITLPATADAKVGTDLTLTPTFDPTTANGTELTWVSSNTAVATVDAATGKITPVAEGTATITATSKFQSDKFASCAVTVTVPVSSVTLSAETLAIAKDKTAKLTATVAPENATNKTVTWASSDEAVATVDQTGLVTAVKAGTANITATADGKTSTACVVTVYALEITGTQTVNVREKTQLTATLSPADFNQPITWTSSNEAVATVDQTGLVTGVSAGTANITATSGDATATVKVTVSTVAVSGITLSPSEGNIKAGKSVTIDATVKPDNATNPALKWSFDDTNCQGAVKSFDVTTQTLTLNDTFDTELIGKTVTVTASASDGSSISKTVTFTIVATPIETITLTPDKEVSLQDGQSVTYTATITPETATYPQLNFSVDGTELTKSDETATSVTLTATAATGDATLIAAPAHPLTGDCAAPTTKITVIPTPVETVTATATPNQIKGGESSTLTATVLPDKATDKTVTWTIVEGSEFATLSGNTLTAISGKTGAVKVRATSNADATKYGETRVQVVEVPVTAITLASTAETLYVGDNVTLTVKTYEPGNATSKTVIWSSNDTEVATVDPSTGVVTAVKAGTATITATCGTVTASATITVQNRLVETITLTPASATLRQGESETFVPSFTPTNATIKEVTWRLDCTEDVATVDPTTGKVTINKVTTATANTTITLTATATDGSGITKTAEITLAPTPIETITLTPSEGFDGTLMDTKSVTFTATVKPDNATDKSVTFSLDTDTYLTKDVSTDGNSITLTAGPTLGKTVLYVVPTNFADGFKAVTEAIEVVATPVSTITVNHNGKSIEATQTLQMEATIAPANATYKDITWSITKGADLATIDPSTGVLTAKADAITGEIEVTATTTKNTPVVTGSATIKVLEVLATGITITTPEKTTLKAGETLTLSATVTPDNASDKTVLWSSSDTTLVAIDDKGVLTVSQTITPEDLTKTVTITATAKGGTDITDTQEITFVKTNVTDITIALPEGQSAAVKQGDTFKLTATASPATATYKDVKWSVNLTGIVSVAEDGTITVGTITEADLANPTVTVTATSKDPDETVTKDIALTLTATPVDSIAVSVDTVKTVAGTKVTFTASVFPETATIKTLTAESADATIATVDAGTDNTFTVVGVKGGQTAITLTANSGKTFEVPVAIADSIIITPVGVTEATNYNVIIGMEGHITRKKFIANVPFILHWIVKTIAENITTRAGEADATEGDNTTITIVEDGIDETLGVAYCIVEGVNIGNAEVTAVLPTDSYNAVAGATVNINACEVRVIAKQYTDLTLDKAEVSPRVGTSVTVKATTTGESSILDLKWSISDPEVAVVTFNEADATFTIKALKTGTAILTVLTTDGSNLDPTCEIKVTQKVVQGPPGSGIDGVEADSAEAAMMRVYDLRGRLVATGLDQYRALESGIYIIRTESRTVKVMKN